MSYNITTFWAARFASVARWPTQPFVSSGWSVGHEPSPAFVEAELRLRPDFDDLAAPVWLVAAPGAVGKSTLAKEISAQTGAVYLDLARAETVAGNYLTGGLVKNGLYDAWRQEQATVLIDALDEARLRVTQSSFEDFLNDVKTLSDGRHLPAVLFGRIGIIEEAWLIFSDRGLLCPVFDMNSSMNRDQ